MTDPIIYIDRSEIQEGQLEKLKQEVEKLADFVEIHVPQVIAYNVYFNQEETRMTIIHAHHDSDSLQALMDSAGPLFPQFEPLIDLLSIEVYGTPSEAVMERLRKKAKMLGDATLEVHKSHAGFARSLQMNPAP